MFEWDNEIHFNALGDYLNPNFRVKISSEQPVPFARKGNGYLQTQNRHHKHPSFREAFLPEQDKCPPQILTDADHGAGKPESSSMRRKGKADGAPLADKKLPASSMQQVHTSQQEDGDEISHEMGRVNDDLNLTDLQGATSANGGCFNATTSPQGQITDNGGLNVDNLPNGFAMNHCDQSHTASEEAPAEESSSSSSPVSPNHQTSLSSTSEQSTANGISICNCDKGIFNQRHLFDLALLAPDFRAWTTEGLKEEDVMNCLEGSHLRLGPSLRARTLVHEDPLHSDFHNKRVNIGKYRW